MTPTGGVLIFLIVGYVTTVIRQAWLSARIDDLKHGNDHLRRDLERDVEVLETQIARESEIRRSTCTQWHREVNTRLWTLENQHDTDADIHEDLDVPDTDTQSIPDKETAPCPTTSETHSSASETPSGEQPETSSTDSPTTSTPIPRNPVSKSTSTTHTTAPDTAPTTPTSKPCENTTDAPDAPRAPGTRPSLTTSTGTGES